METNEVNIKNWKSLIKPPKLDVNLSEDKSYAKIIAEPLEKGYGLTLGNSLRRILLSQQLQQYKLTEYFMNTHQ